MPNSTLIEFVLADANLLAYKQSLSNLDRIALELDMLKKEIQPINAWQMLSNAMDYTSSIALSESTRDPQAANDYYAATLRIKVAVEELERAEAN